MGLDWQQVANVAVGAFLGGLLPVALVWLITASTRKREARQWRGIEHSLGEIENALHRIAYWSGFDAKRQAAANVEAETQKIREAQARNDDQDRG